MPPKIGNNLAERLKIQEKALQNLAETLKKRETKFDEEMSDVLEDLKAIKVFLSRNMPEFKKEFLAIRKKLKAA